MNTPRTVTRIGIRSILPLIVTTSLFAGSADSLPKSASIVIVPSPYDEYLVPTGDVKVTFSDGRSEVWTHSGDCRDAKVSTSGSVGWIRMDKKHVDTHRMMLTGKDSLVVRLPYGKLREFSPYDENVGIMDWRFADDGKAVIVRSMGFHGPSSYAKYEISTGHLIDARGPDYTPYDKLPSWVKPLADPKYD
jgi:hypothetical protein